MHKVELADTRVEGSMDSNTWVALLQASEDSRDMVMENP